MNDAVVPCARCSGTGAADGAYCSCVMGAALRTAPSVRIGNEVYVFPPGTTMAEAEAAVALANKLYRESLS